MYVPERAETGIVHQQLDFNQLAMRELEDFIRRSRLGQVRDAHFDLHSVLRRQLGRQFLQPIRPPGGQNQIDAALRRAVSPIPGQFRRSPRLSGPIFQTIS